MKKAEVEYCDIGDVGRVRRFLVRCLVNLLAMVIPNGVIEIECNKSIEYDFDGQAVGGFINLSIWKLTENSLPPPPDYSGFFGATEQALQEASAEIMAQYKASLSDIFPDDED